MSGPDGITELGWAYNDEDMDVQRQVNREDLDARADHILTLLQASDYKVVARALQTVISIALCAAEEEEEERERGSDPDQIYSPASPPHLSSYHPASMSVSSGHTPHSPRSPKAPFSPRSPHSPLANRTPRGQRERAGRGGGSFTVVGLGGSKPRAPPMGRFPPNVLLVAVLLRKDMPGVMTRLLNECGRIHPTAPTQGRRRAPISVRRNVYLLVEILAAISSGCRSVFNSSPVPSFACDICRDSVKLPRSLPAHYIPSLPIHAIGALAVLAGHNTSLAHAAVNKGIIAGALDVLHVVTAKNTEAVMSILYLLGSVLRASGTYDKHLTKRLFACLSSLLRYKTRGPRALPLPLYSCASRSLCLEGLPTPLLSLAQASQGHASHASAVPHLRGAGAQAVARAYTAEWCVRLGLELQAGGYSSLLNEYVASGLLQQSVDVLGWYEDKTYLVDAVQSGLHIA
ncbi:hypothetical protein KIPB_006356 [Kipferlia bialata]|uniref:Uncharacterized protein n=1 Tax=Kipferlia bialata TaxID=797122 RepID=A0A9K3GJP3_9EUKA|nr:hypothetical protein KIPB_006356 [Kipferlia bialata]|eukprot:g6356.t1